MRALVVENYGPIEDHCVKEVPVPPVGDGDVLIEVRAIGLNFPDALMLQGKYQKRPDTPFVPGRDASGIVRAVGRDVTRFKTGDRVACQVFTGAFAEMVAAPEKRCFPMVDGIDFDTAAALITAHNTAYVAVHLRAEARPSEVAVVTGAAGGVGLACIQLLKAIGTTVVALVSSEAKAELVRANGADHVILTAGDGPKDRIHDSIMAVTAGRGADLVFETVGGDIFAFTIRTLAFGGRMIVIGFASAEIPVVKTNYLLYRNLAVLGSPLDIQFDHEYEKILQGVELIQSLFLQGRVKANIMDRVPLDRIKDGFALITGRHATGKVVAIV